jgi:prolyl-tRNA synthetase
MRKKASVKEDAKRGDIGMKHRKEDFSDWYSEVIAKAELADLRYNIKGFLVHRPWSVLAMKNMYRLYEEEFERTGHEPAWFPAVIPESNFRMEAEHVEGFAPELLWITHSGSEKLTERMALRPTSETAMYVMYAKWIRSWRDLPFKIYQSCQVWRCDTKATRPFIRGREFHWIEGHDVFATLGEAEDQVREDMEMTENVMHRMYGIPFIQIQRPEWDKFPGAVHTYVADTVMPDGKILQQPSTHLLGQNFAKAFGIKFKDTDEHNQYPWQTCYGPAIWRMLASVIALHGDDRGLRFPYGIAPVQVMIVPITGLGDDIRIERRCREIEEKLKSGGIRARTDLSENTPGWKFNQWEMKGVPVRIEIGPEELKSRRLTLSRRDTGKRQKVTERKLLEAIERAGREISRNLREEAEALLRRNIREARDIKELGGQLRKGGFVKIDFCSIETEGIPCAEKIKERFHAQVRGKRFDRKEKPRGKCVICGKPANCVVYVGREY